MSNDWFDLFPGHKADDEPLAHIVRRCLPVINELDWQGKHCLIDLQQIREKCLEEAADCAPDPQSARVIVSTLCDLRGQGWKFRLVDSKIQARKPSFDADENTSPQEIKSRIRAGLLLERDVQLQKPSIKSFVQDMERRRLGPNGWVSIFSLMRDGAELASKLTPIADMPLGAARESALREVIDPYIQVVDDSRCEHTWLWLKDIWRYFRYTWSTPSQSVPGRNIWFLIRDRAGENHPVVGIAALGSAIVQMKERDKWIGWHRSVFLAQLDRKPSKKWASWIHTSLEQLIVEIYLADFVEEGLLEESEIEAPDSELIKALNTYAAEQREVHRLYPQKTKHKSNVSDVDWEERAKTALFKSKRARTLAKLLDARRRLRKAGFIKPSAGALAKALKDNDAKNAIASILRRVKASRVGVNMMDITVCGAIPPYNPILGGKLVSLLMTSPEIVEAYRERYQDQPSIIASSMAGREVVRNQTLVLLGTTSLYGIGSSQYNRLRLPADKVGGKQDAEIRFKELDKTRGYGSFHLSSATLAEIGKFSAQAGNSRRVNSIFGEGVNPRLRKAREALDKVGFDSDAVLKHENRRIIYGISLAENYDDVLLGLTDDVKWVLPEQDPEQVTHAIAGFWIRRWLSKRINKKRFLTVLEQHTATYPVQHGARVELPVVAEKDTLFSE